MRAHSETVAGHCFRERRVRHVFAFLAAASLIAFVIAPVSSAPLRPQSPPSPQGATPTAEELASLRQKAETGDGDAQHALGTLHLLGQGVSMDKAEALKWFALEAYANGNERPELYSAFDRIAGKVHQSQREEALSRARSWAVDFDRRSPSPGRKRGKSLMSIFRATYPRLAREVKPFYSKAAMERKIEGTVELDCVVNAYGTVGDCQVVDSLDSVYGLDQEALKAVRQWRFIPGTIRGKPASLPVTIRLTFTLKQ